MVSMSGADALALLAIVVSLHRRPKHRVFNRCTMAHCPHSLLSLSMLPQDHVCLVCPLYLRHHKHSSCNIGLLQQNCVQAHRVLLSACRASSHQLLTTGQGEPEHTFPEVSQCYGTHANLWQIMHHTKDSSRPEHLPSNCKNLAYTLAQDAMPAL